ncbi:MAG: CHAT domain-containing protein [Leptolyngbya sp. SIO1E4]|nr:CHAT domain-containing protein [Leptolyngbya sp. SIO1E4]
MAQIGFTAIAGTTALFLTALGTSPAAADGISPANDGTGTQVNRIGNDHAITGGTPSADTHNLFHSFSDFNLLTGETATFLTDPAIQNILSRITGSNPSLIDGLLQVSGSDANLFLINPSGILLGPNSALNLQGSFTAITADQVNFATGTFGTVGTPDYAALVGNPQSFSFTANSPGSVVNAGTLSVLPGESVVLVGGQVLNTGTITTPGGTVIISAVDGNSLVRIAQEGLLLNLEVATLPDSPQATLLPFTPTTLPELLTGNAIGEAAGVTVNPDGSITLTESEVALPAEPGTAIVSGTLDASGEDFGGQLTVLGDTIGLLAATLETSGDRSGGTIRVGGEYKGEGPLPTAAITFVDGASTLIADALVQGDGGRIIVWSDQTTRSYGSLSARGGTAGGNGGFVETSSLGFLETTGAPDVGAPNGQGGTWLIDPFDIEIGFFTTTGFPNNNNPFVAESGPAQLDWGDIEAAFGTTPGVRVTVSTGVGGGDNGDITVVDGVDLAGVPADANLEFRAAGDIEIIPELTSSGGVSFDFEADTDNNGSGQIRIDNLLETQGGNILLQGADAGAAPAIDVRAPLRSNGGDISLLSRDSDIQITSLDAGGGAISIITPGLIRVTDTPSILTTGGAEITLEHGGSGATPFTVGDSATNGTAAGISNGANTVPFQAFSGTVSFGNIEIRTDTPNNDPGPSDIPDNFDPDEVDCFGGCDDFGAEPGGEDFSGGGFEEDFEFEEGGRDGFRDEERSEGRDNGFRDEEFDDGRGDDDGFRDEDRGDDDFRDEERGDDDFRDEERDEEPDEARGEEDLRDEGFRGGRGEDFEEISYDEWAFDDRFYADEFVNHFNLPVIPEPDFETSQGTLRSLTETVGTPPALVYARFRPAGSGTVARQPFLKQAQRFNPQPTDVLELVLVTPDSQPKRITVPSATREKVLAAVRQLQIELTDRTRRRRTTYLQPAQRLYSWLVTPLEDNLETEAVGHVSFIMAAGLRSLPLAALHDGEQFIIEKYSVGLMPSLALTDTRYSDLRQAPVLAMGASEFTDQPDLPAVPFELRTIVGQLRQGERSLNETFTPQTLISLRQASGYPVLHLATHGEFRAGGPDNSYIQFWNQRLGLDQLRQLQLNDPPLDLLVMSACRTALGDTAAELGFAGLAVQAGVKSALATLWQVSDLETAGLMAEFYTQLNQQPYKAEALRQAQLAMLRGEVTVVDGKLTWNGGSQPLPAELTDLRFGNIQHPYYWAAFTLVGSPW